MGREPVQFAEFLAQHDLVWDTAPTRWLDGVPLANGRIGAMVWGEGAPLHLTLDKYDCWEMREQVPDPAYYTYEALRRLVAAGDEETINAKHWHEVYVGAAVHVTRLPLPRLELDFGQAADSFAARLLLHDATLRGELGFGGEQAGFEILVSAAQNLILVTLDTLRLPTVEVTLEHLKQPQGDFWKAEGIPCAWELLKRWGYPDPERGAADGVNWLRQAFPAGGEYAVAWALQSHEGGSCLYLSMASHNDADEPVQGAISMVRAAARAGPEALREEHRSWWRRFWSASHLTIPEPRLENLYYAEMYKLGCLSRPEGMPITLQGLWTEDGRMPPWSGDYHLDLNVQQCYWPIYTANRLELGECLYETFFAMLPRFERNCREFFGFDGAWTGCSLGPNGARVYGYATTEFWPGNGAWLAFHFWQHWLYSRDERFLRERAVPFMAPFMRTYMNLLEEGPDGRLHVPLSNSPEYGESGITAWASDPSCDLALIRALGSALLEADALLGLAHPEAPRWRETLERLTDYPQDAQTGLHVAAGKPYAMSHRHLSHLMAIYPLGLLTADDPAHAELMDRSLRNMAFQGMGEWGGGICCWASCLGSRAGLGNMAWFMLDLFALAHVAPNTLDVSGDWRRYGISTYTHELYLHEGGPAFAAALQEMLLQSHGGVIRVFPAIPDHWHDACFSSLRAERGFTVSALLRDGRVVSATITSELGGLCRVRNGWGCPVDVRRAGAEGSDLRLEGEIIEFDTEAGRSYRLRPVGQAAAAHELQPQLPVRGPEQRHWFGLQRRLRL